MLILPSEFHGLVYSMPQHVIELDGKEELAILLKKDEELDSMVESFIAIPL